MTIHLRRLCLTLFAICALTSAPALASNSHRHSSGHRSSSSSSHARRGRHATAKTKQKGAKASHAKSSARSTTTAPSVHRANRCTSCDRDANGHILRSVESKDAFKRATGYPHGRPGYVIDHVVPLACGGADLPSNMQWQTNADAKAKDTVERKGCR